MHSLCGSSVAGEGGRLSSRKTADSGGSSGPYFSAGSRLQGAAHAFCLSGHIAVSGDKAGQIPSFFNLWVSLRVIVGAQP